MGEWIYALFCQRLAAGWLVGVDGAVVIDRAERILTEFAQSLPQFIAIGTPDPIEFIATLMAGCRWGVPIFLCNPRWGAVEWAQVSLLTDRVDPQLHQNLIMIPTGGSSGSIKFAIHTWETLSASAWGFQEFYGLDKINSVCTLPLYHVSGLMQLVRSLLTDGKLAIVAFYQLGSDANTLIRQLDLDRYFISLVPTQLAKLLALDVNWLTSFQTILIGGAPPSLELLNTAILARLPLALTYGMTETASQVTSLKPAEFLDGNNSCGRVLPHASIQLMTTDDDRVQTLRIQAKSLMLGYFPQLSLPKYFEPDDVGTFNFDGYLTILGRNSGKIITGGENVFPIEVVDVIMATDLVADVWVIGLPDRYWGQIVTAIYVAKERQVSIEILKSAIVDKISNYKIPKQWICVDRIPRNALGKISMPEVAALAVSIVDRVSRSE
jgi:o-succinylbenzoate---CoA ligase